MKRSAPTSSSAPCSSDDADAAIISGWQQWQARFRKSKNVSLLEDHHIDPHVLDHMQLKPSSSTSATTASLDDADGDDDNIFAYLPRRRNSSIESIDTSNKNNHHNDDHYYSDGADLASASALPFPTLRRDHSSGGGRLSLHNKRQKISTFAGGV